MKIKLSYLKSVHENAGGYYQLAKETRQKIEGLEEAIKETQKEMELATKEQKKEIRVKREKEWFEKFHHMKTNSGLLAIGGRNVQQNDQLVSKHMTEADLFFHAEIQGAAVFILKEGVEKATEKDLLEVAQFAACFSNAWKNANASVDVYAAEKKQLTKNVSGGFVQAGAFAILGERKWFRGTKLLLRLGLLGGIASVLPEVSEQKLEKQLLIYPAASGKDKGSLAKSIAKRLSAHPDDLLSILPNGKSKTKE